MVLLVQTSYPPACSVFLSESKGWSTESCSFEVLTWMVKSGGFSIPFRDKNAKNCRAVQIELAQCGTAKLTSCLLASLTDKGAARQIETPFKLNHYMTMNAFARWWEETTNTGTFNLCGHSTENNKKVKKSLCYNKNLPLWAEKCRDALNRLFVEKPSKRGHLLAEKIS